MITPNNTPQANQDLFVIQTEERLETVQVAAETAYVSCALDAGEAVSE